MNSADSKKELLEDRWLSIDEIATYLGISKDTVYVWLAKGLPGYKVVRIWRFKRSEVDAWVKNHDLPRQSSPYLSRFLKGK